MRNWKPGLCPLGMNTFGAFGSQAQLFLGTLFTKYVKRCASEEGQRYTGQLHKECWVRWSMTMHKAVAQHLCGAFALLGATDIL